MGSNDRNKLESSSSLKNKKEAEAKKILTSIQAGLKDIKTENTKPVDSLLNELNN